MNLACGPLPFQYETHCHDRLSPSFGAFGRLSEGDFFVMNALRSAPKGFLAWLMERDQRPGMVKLRENRSYAHKVAAKLIQDKKQELKDGTPRKDLLSLLGSSRITFPMLDK